MVLVGELESLLKGPTAWSADPIERGTPGCVGTATHIGHSHRQRMRPGVFVRPGIVSRLASINLQSEAMR